MARSPRTLEGYLQFSRALAAGKLTPELREQIALTVAQANRCEYCITQHAAQARQFGLSSEEILASCDGHADVTTNAEPGLLLHFTFDDAVDTDSGDIHSW